MHYLTPTLLLATAWISLAAPASEAPNLQPRDAPEAMPYPPALPASQCPMPNNAWANVGIQRRDRDSTTTADNLEERSLLGGLATLLTCQTLGQTTLVNVPDTAHNSIDVGPLITDATYYVTYGLDTNVWSLVIWAAPKSDPSNYKIVAQNSPVNKSGMLQFKLSQPSVVHVYFQFAVPGGPVNGQVGMFATAFQPGEVPTNG